MSRGKWITYSPDELSFLQENKEMPRRALHDVFCKKYSRNDVSVDAIKSLMTRMGWNTGRDGRFAKGSVAPNKGKKMPFNINSARTQFKAGNRPHTWRGAGHESVDQDGYVWLIVNETNPYTGAPTRRVMKHKWLWEQENGPVPKGHVLKSVDGNRQNTDPTNWAAVSRSLLPRLNGRFGRGYDSADDEIKPVILAACKVAQTVFELRNPRKRRGGTTQTPNVHQPHSGQQRGP
ncbi:MULTISPECIES: HNH endonuclease signature motif containing protein [unclassified Haematobacter]|uniref:HNH endonuclease signature motif containing protein n=1 Tax=unclassified Haematobacter TaxID=2640585 RepID=UPI0025B9D436|nr:MULTISPECIES: HNH endonuclease [unclassified Haematobacter]